MLLEQRQYKVVGRLSFLKFPSLTDTLLSVVSMKCALVLSSPVVGDARFYYGKTTNACICHRPETTKIVKLKQKYLQNFLYQEMCSCQ